MTKEKRSFYQKHDKLVIKIGMTEELEAEEVKNRLEHTQMELDSMHRKVRILTEYVNELSKFERVADNIINKRIAKGKEDVRKAKSTVNNGTQ